MASSFIYRRGTVFWWRYVLYLYQNERYDIRLSLKTSDRRVAQRRGAFLMAGSESVENMINESLREPDERPDHSVLKAIAAKAFQERLAACIEMQQNAEGGPKLQQQINSAYADYYQLMLDTRGAPGLPDEVQHALLAKGWSPDRLQRLILVIEQHENGQPAVKQSTVDALLRQQRFEPHNGIRGMARMAIFEGYRDACRAANDDLDIQQGNRLDAPFIDIRAETDTPSRNRPGRGDTGSMPHDAYTTPEGYKSQGLPLSAALELCIERNSGADGWSADTKKQARKAAEMLIFIAGDVDVENLTQTHLSDLRSLFDKLPNRHGRTTAEREGGLAASLIRATTMPNDMLGLSSETMNKHFTWISALLKAAKSKGHMPHAKLDFEPLRQKSQSAAARKSKGRARDRRASWSLEQIARLLRAPIWTGCRGIDLRFEAGEVIYHDAWYWLPLFNVLYGGRSSETAGLELSEIYEDAPIPYFSVEDTELRKLKNSQSNRKLPIHPELIRLGFLDYVREMRRLGHIFLFPEMYSPKSKSFAKTYYSSIFQHWRAWAYPDGTPWRHQVRGAWKDCDVHSFRGAVSTALKGVPDGVRYDILGHEGNNATTIFYDGETNLDMMRDALVKLTPLTAHIDHRSLSMRPSDRQHHGRARKVS